MKYVLAVAIIMLLMMGWVAVQHLYRLFAAKHPELGPYRDDVACGGGCGCGAGSCSTSAEEER